MSNSAAKVATNLSVKRHYSWHQEHDMIALHEIVVNSQESRLILQSMILRHKLNHPNTIVQFYDHAGGGGFGFLYKNNKSVNETQNHSFEKNVKAQMFNHASKHTRTRRNQDLAADYSPLNSANHSTKTSMDRTMRGCCCSTASLQRD